MITLLTNELVKGVRGVNAVPTDENINTGYLFAILLILLFLAAGALIWVLAWLLKLAFFATWFAVALWFDWWWVPTGIGLSYVVIPYLIWLARNKASLVRVIGCRLRALRNSTLIGGSIGAALSLMALAGNLSNPPEERSVSMWESFWMSTAILVLVFAFIGRTVQFIWDEMAVLIRALGPKPLTPWKMSEIEPLKDHDAGNRGPQIQRPGEIGTLRKILFVCSIVSLSLMALIGSYEPSVWSGTGYTRGSGDWIPIWSKLAGF